MNRLYCLCQYFMVVCSLFGALFSCKSAYLPDALGEQAIGVIDTSQTQVFGNFLVGTNTNTTNYVSLPVYVSKMGKFQITATSDSPNGISFSSAFVTSDTGLQTFIVRASGVPKQAITSSYSIQFNGSNISKFIIPTTTIPIVSTANTWTIVDDAGQHYAGALQTCSSASIRDGTYKAITLAGYFGLDTLFQVQFGVPITANFIPNVPMNPPATNLILLQQSTNTQLYNAAGSNTLEVVITQLSFDDDNNYTLQGRFNGRVIKNNTVYVNVTGSFFFMSPNTSHTGVSPNH